MKSEGPAARAQAALQALWWQPSPSWAAQCLRPLSMLYAALFALRTFAYRRGWLAAGDAGVPVLVVGNLIAGGAGKTPTVMALVQLLREAGWRPGIVSRGHGRRSPEVREVLPDSRAEDCGDEPLLLRIRCAVPVFVGAQRLAAAQALRARHPQVNLLLCDDGLQHLALRRNLQVLVFDDRGVGNGLPLPAGPLRQPLPRRLDAHTLVLYNAAQPSTPLPGALARRGLAGAVELAAWWRGEAATLGALAALAGAPGQRPGLWAVAGMAAPQRFFSMLNDAGLQPRTQALSDHFDFATLPWPAQATDVLVTEKDAVKLQPGRTGSARVWVVRLDFRFPQDFVQAVMQRLGTPPP